MVTRLREELLALKDRPTARFLPLTILWLRGDLCDPGGGLKIPQDVAMVGFDDRDFAAWIRPALTTVRMPSFEMGQAAARLLLQQIAGEDLEDATQVPGKLIIRKSCGAKALHEAGITGKKDLAVPNILSR